MMRQWALTDAVEVKLNEYDDFLRIKETLSRIGIANNKTKRLYQTCHILHKRGKYYIIHFKAMFALDGKQSDFDVGDWERQNTIAKLLSEWDLCEVENKDDIKHVSGPQSIKIIKYTEKHNWDLVSKYNVGS